MSTPASIPELFEQVLIDLAIENWRLSRVFQKVLAKLDAGEAARYASQLRYSQRKMEESLEAAGLKLVNLEGHPFDPGMAADPVNLDDFEPDVPLLVEQMLEPIIMSTTGLKKSGTVVLRKAHL